MISDFFPSNQDLYSYSPIKLSRNASFPSEFKSNYVDANYVENH